MRTRTHHGHPVRKLTVHHRRHNDSPCFPCPLATGMIAAETDRTSGK